MRKKLGRYKPEEALEIQKLIIDSMQNFKADNNEVEPAGLIGHESN